MNENKEHISDLEEQSFLDYQQEVNAAIEKKALQLNLGSGIMKRNDWINLDMHPREDTLTMRLPQGLKRFRSDCVRYIYTSHFLEHISYPDEAGKLMRECYRILQPGGVIRIIVPGIEKIIRAYAEDDQAFFEIQASLHPEWCTTKLDHLMYALQQDGEHQYGYDYETLHKLLTTAGFSNIYRSDYNQSEFENMNIDNRSLKDNHGRYLSLFVEAIKDA